MTDQFAAWVGKGLGRAVLYLKTNDSTPCREALLHACTHNLIYDRQCEESRTPYLLELIELSGDTEFYRNGILTALKSDDDQVDQGQMFELAASFAEKGDNEIKQNMYSAFERDGFGLTAADELVRLDGLRGLVFVAKSFGAEDPEERPWQFGHLIETLETQHGKQTLPAQLDDFLREWREYEAIWERARQKPPEPRPDYETVKHNLTRLGYRWARNASIQELEIAADDLLAENDKERLFGYLNMFRLRRFPKAIDQLLELARTADQRVARAAVFALSNIQDQRVRALGLDLMAGAKWWRGDAVNLLTHNSQDGDYRILEDLLEQHADPDEYDWLGHGVLRFVETHRSEEAERALLLLYENGPCTLCRYRVVKELIAIGHLPHWVREECQYDAYSETRKLVKSPA
jgi:hypothetical protein